MAARLQDRTLSVTQEPGLLSVMQLLVPESPLVRRLWRSTMQALKPVGSCARVHSTWEP